MRSTSLIVAVLDNGKMVARTPPKRPLSANFVIVCEYGDWSGFRTLAACQAQYGELDYVEERF